jgi:uncharacterized protein (DUF488 family)
VSEPIKLFTIGFTKKNARTFFTRLKGAGVTRVLDVRLNNVSQLAGFAKKEDLKYFLDAIAGIGYEHLADLAPTQDILTAFKKNKGDWSVYEAQFMRLMQSRKIEDAPRREHFQHGCLLCSEDKPHHCHRRLVAEYLAEKWGSVEIVHL